MSPIYSLLKYLGIGVCLGIGILLVDQIYLKYGNPRQIAVMEELLEELYESHADLIELGGMSSFPALSINVFGKSLQFEERCNVFFGRLSSFRCEDYPHSTSARLSFPDNLDAQIENLKRIAKDGSIREEQLGEFRVVRWFTDIDKLSEVMEGLREEPRTELRGTPLPMPETPPSFSALVCLETGCLTISSLSRTKVEGLVAQLVDK